MIADAAATVPTVVSLIVALGGLVGILSYRSRNRDTNASATSRLADATDKLADTGVAIYKAAMDALQERVDTMATEITELRDAARAAESSAADARLEAQRARTDKAKAQTRIAELEAELAKALKEAGDERHALRTEFADYRLDQERRDVIRQQEWDERSAAYEATIVELTDRIDTLSAQLGRSDRRDSDRRAQEAAQTARQGDQDVRQSHQDDRQGRQDERELRQDASDQQRP